MANEIKFGFENAEHSPGYLLWQVTMLWQRNIKRGLDVLNITHTQFVLLSVLANLSKNKKAVSQVDIANSSKTDRMMVSKVLRTLERKGFLERMEHEKDTRAKTVVLTESGKNILQKAIVLVEDIDKKFFSAYNAEKKSINEILLSLILINEQ